MVDAENTNQDAASPIREVYACLRALAQQQLSHERPGHTLSATALVHEAYLRLGNAAGMQKAQFYGAAIEAMRRILIDYARKRNADKRGGARQRLDFSVLEDLFESPDDSQILAFDRELVRMESEYPNAAAVVRFRFYAGLTIEQCAEVMGVSTRTVNREWTFARAWLFRRLSEDAGQHDSPERTSDVPGGTRSGQGNL